MLNYMALAGYDTEISMKMLPTVLDLAAAGNIDLAYASNMVTDAQSALGLSLEQTELMVDQMAKTSSTTNTSVIGLGEAFLAVGGTANIMKDGTAEMAQVIGILADNGIHGAEGGTKLRNVLLKLSAPTSAGTKQLQKLGVSIFTTSGEMRSFSEIFPELNAALSELTDEQRTQAIAEIFNTQDIGAVNALLYTSAERWEEVASAIDDAEGSASKMAKTQLDTLAGDIVYFKSALEGAQIALSDVLTPSLREFVQFGTDGLQRLTEAFKSDGITGAMEVLGGLLQDATTMIVGKLPDLISVAVQIFSAIFNGVALALPQIVSKLIEALPGIYSSILSGLSTLGESILQIFEDALDSVGMLGQWQTIKQSFIDFWDKIKEPIANAWETVYSSVVGLINSIRKAAEPVIDLIIGIFDEIFDGEDAANIINALSSGFAALANGVSRVIDFLGDFIAAIKEPAIAGFAQIWDSLRDAVSKVSASLSELFSEFSGHTTEIDLFNGAVSLVSGVITNLSNEISTVITFLADFISGTVNVAKKCVEDFLGWFNEIYEKLETAAKLIRGELSFEDIWEQANKPTRIGEIIVEAALDDTNYELQLDDLAAQTAEMLGHELPPLWDSYASEVEQAGGETVNSYLAGFAKNQSGIFSSVSNAALDAVKALEDPIEPAGESGESTIWSFVNGITAHKSDAKSAIDEIASTTNGLSKNNANTYSWGSDMLSGFISGIKSKLPSLSSVVSSAASTVRSFLHFSVPDEGPMSDADEWMPDMMALFAEGIKKNKHLVTDEIQKSFDFGDMVVNSVPTTEENASSSGIGVVNINITGANYSDEESLAEAISERLQTLVNRRSAVWA